MTTHLFAALLVMLILPACGIAGRDGNGSAEETAGQSTCPGPDDITPRTEDEVLGRYEVGTTQKNFPNVNFGAASCFLAAWTEKVQPQASSPGLNDVLDKTSDDPIELEPHTYTVAGRLHCCGADVERTLMEFNQLSIGDETHLSNQLKVETYALGAGEARIVLRYVGPTYRAQQTSTQRPAPGAQNVPQTGSVSPASKPSGGSAQEDSYFASMLCYDAGRQLCADYAQCIGINRRGISGPTQYRLPYALNCDSRFSGRECPTWDYFGQAAAGIERGEIFRECRTLDHRVGRQFCLPTGLWSDDCETVPCELTENLGRPEVFCSPSAAQAPASQTPAAQDPQGQVTPESPVDGSGSSRSVELCVQKPFEPNGLLEWLVITIAGFVPEALANEGAPRCLLANIPSDQATITVDLANRFFDKDQASMVDGNTRCNTTLEVANSNPLTVKCSDRDIAIRVKIQ